MSQAARPSASLATAQPADGPTADAYVFARWRELCDANAPWWARSPGIGLRLRLRELVSLARALQEGALMKRPIEQLTLEGRAALQPNGALMMRYEPLGVAVRKALSTKPEHWHPAGQAHATVQAALQHLSDPSYLRVILDELESQAGKVSKPHAFANLDQQVELLDAELAFDGHSPAWRAAVCDAAARRLAQGTSIADAIRGALEANRHGLRQEMEVIMGLAAKLESPAEVAVKLPFLDSELILETIEPWYAEVDDEALLDLPSGALHLRIEAADTHAALLDAESRIAQYSSLWHLQGGDVHLLGNALVYDPSVPEVRSLSRTPPLELMPEGLAQHESRLARMLRSPPNEEEDEDALTDALVQLAQARTGSAASTLTDLWVVVESLFAGVAGEPKHEAATVIASMLQARMVRDKLAWLADELQAVGKQKPGGEARASWALRQLVEDAQGVGEALSNRPLAAARAAQMQRWLSGSCLQKDLAAVQARCEGVAARAYLVRNFFVHGSNPQRAVALAATLLPFSGMVRAALSMLTTTDDHPLVAAQVAAISASQVAHLIGKGYVSDERAAARAIELSVRMSDS